MGRDKKEVPIDASTVPTKNLICWKCARKAGCQCNGSNTVWEEKCDFCDKITSVSPVTDYVWPNGEFHYVWD